MPVNKYSSIIELIEKEQPEEPIICLYPETVALEAKRFLNSFPGKVLYAVKANRDPEILKCLYNAGIRHFDVASIKEMEVIKEKFPDALCYFNHPVKSRKAIKLAYDLYGIRDFVIDHEQELDKLFETLGTSIIVQVRIAQRNTGAILDFATKFGADMEDATYLLQRVHKTGAKAALSFHVGSQCRNLSSYKNALHNIKKILDDADVPVCYLNIGGGFPVSYSREVPEIEDYFSTIKSAMLELGRWRNLPLLSEPGRILVARGQSILVQVHLRKDDAIYINDGIFGSLSELRDLQIMPPMAAFGRDRILRGEPVAFRAFGPTCDPIDIAPKPFILPDDIDEGDWILIDRLGAYSNVLITSFNGMDTHKKVIIKGTSNSEMSL